MVVQPVEFYKADVHGRKQAYEEHKHTQSPEEVHGPFAETRQEPNGDVVKKTVHKTLHAKFGRAILSCLVHHDFFTYFAKAGIFLRVRECSGAFRPKPLCFLLRVSCRP